MRGKFFFGVAAAALMAWSSPALAQDQAGDNSTRANIAPGQTVDGEINPAGDSDWYRLSVETGQRYSLALDGVANTEGVALDPMLAIIDSQGNQLAFNDDAEGLNSRLHYAPAARGDVFVDVRAFGEEQTGAYRLSVTAAALPADAVGNDASTRARIRPGAAIAGSIDYEGDVDAYRLNARSNQRYTIALASSGETPLQDPYLVVTDADGQELASNDDFEGLNSQLEFTPRTSGPVFVQARGLADAYTGGYSLSVAASALPHDAVGADRNTRGRITAGQHVDGTLDFASDADWYRIRLVEGQTYRFTLNSSGDPALGDPLLRVLNANGEELAVDDDGGGNLNSYLEFAAPRTGTYFLEARGFTEDATGGYTLGARDGDIPADASTDAAVSADGDYRESVLSPAGDRDWYRIELTEGQTLRIGLIGAEAGDALPDPYLILYGANGEELARDDDGGEGLNAALEYQAVTAGPHYIEVRGFSDDAAGRYALNIASGEIGSSLDSADYIAVNGEGRVSIIGTPDDVDWFALELVEGRPYRFNLQGVEPNPLADPYLVIHDSSGVELKSDDDGGSGLNAYLSFTSPTGGTHYLAVSSYNASGAGRYMLSAVDTDVPGNIYTDETLSLASEPADGRASRIDVPRDVDTYRVMLEAGVSYVIDVNGDGDTPLADPFVAVAQGENAQIATDDDGGPGLDARLRFTPTEAGEYYIQVSGLGGSTGDYKVQIARR
ncbi:MAG: PPC domain-containing protein [Hyphomonadaceae bacterium]|nr:PPC domain-containing protein [Hyphomonadaceae bacterium]